VLLIPATVRPNTDRVLAVTDPATRLAQLLGSTRRWLSVLDPARTRVLVTENSGADLSGLERLGRAWSPDCFSVLPTPEAVPTARGGKSSGEARMVQAAVAELAREGLPPETPVVKCTGRLYVANHTSYGPLSGDLRVALRSELLYADSRYWTVRLGVLREHFADLDDDVDEAGGTDMENVFARRSLAAIGAGARWERWPRLPRVEGISGSGGQPYHDTRGLFRLAVHELVRTAAARRPFAL